jgi:lambda repressor-like predicted transcriptional regulator
MEHEEMLFEEFLGARMREKGVSLKRLSEATGIAPGHLENMLHGNFDDMPSTPYFHGYVMRVAKVLDFDGAEWWEKLKRDGVIAKSGEFDTLPKNRFIKQSPQKFIWAGAILIIILIYLAFQAPRVFGKPSLTILSPTQNPYTSFASTLTISGKVANADALYLSSGNATSGDEIAIAPDGSWQKTVLLQNGPNPFRVSAKKFLGGETDVLVQILYESPTNGTSSASTSPLFPVIHSTPTVPATGSFFE